MWFFALDRGAGGLHIPNDSLSENTTVKALRSRDI
jgi:hypothetical protein